MKNVISFTAKSEDRIGATAYLYQEEYARINGISEYLLHYPASPEAPVILHIHGGPGAPASVFSHRVEAFARNYNIVYYDQRGAGKTLRRNPCASLSGVDVAQFRQFLTGELPIFARQIDLSAQHLPFHAAPPKM